MDLIAFVKVTEVIFRAEGECFICAGRLVEELIIEFPEYREIAESAYTDRFHRKLGDYS